MSDIRKRGLDWITRGREWTREEMVAAEIIRGLLAEHETLLESLRAANARAARLDHAVGPTGKPLDSLPLPTAAVLYDVAAERVRQDKQWRRTPGVWDDPDGVKLAVLVEEVGEVASEVQPGGSEDKLRAELIQIAAVAVAWAETLP